MPLLSIEDLTIRFGSPSSPDHAVQDRPAVDRLSLRIEPGESLGLVGESGSGKSVTALAILRLLDPAARVSGAIHFQPGAAAPVDLLALPAEAMRRLRGAAIGMIFQEPMTALNPVMPVGEQIAEAIRAHHPWQSSGPGQSSRQLREATLAAMEAVALPDPARRARDYPHQFSGGQRQRILIAMAIVNHPVLLIADEPTTALDVTVQAQILDLLADLRERYNLAMLFISHDLAVVSKVADHVAVMRGGVLLEQGPARSIFNSPLHAYTRSLIGAIPTLTTPLDQPLATVGGAPGDAASAGSISGRMREATPGHWVRS